MASTTTKSTKKVTKKVTKKKVVKKKSVNKKTVKKKAIKKKAPNKKTAKRAQTTNDKIKVTHEQRHKMICEAAYYISLDKTYETVNPTEDWLQAESFIDRICTIHTK